MKKKQADQFVEEFVHNSHKDITEIGKNLIKLDDKDANPIIKKILELKHQSKTYYRNCESILAKAATIDVSNSNPNLAVIFFNEWRHTSYASERFDEAKIIDEILNNYCKEKIFHPVIDIMLQQMKLLFLPTQDSLSRIPNLICQMDFEYGRSRNFLNFFMTYFCHFGLIENLIQQVNNIKKTIDTDWEKKYPSIYLYNCLANIQISESRRLLSTNKNLLKDKGKSISVNTYLDLLEKRDSFQMPPKKNYSKIYYNYLHTNWLLFSHKPSEALELVSKDILLKPVKHTLNLPLPFFWTRSLLRCALVNKNTNLAKIILSRVQEDFLHFLDDFYFSRIELLEGNRKKASIYFENAYNQCKKNNALSLLNVELDLALEVSRSDLMFLTMSLNNSKKDISAKPKVFKSKHKITLHGINRIIGTNPQTMNLRSQVSQFATLEIPIFIRGETGVGKEIIARALHEESPNQKNPFLPINCSAISETLLQSELFGHEAGAFTGAGKAKKGIFETAKRGTVFLDEIGDISDAMQKSLLRVLEANEIRPVGSSIAKAIECRILFATNAPLEKLVEKGLFRKDLFYRIARLSIYISSLREKASDIEPLVNYFIQEFHLEKSPPTIDTDLLDAYNAYQWPGNIRELKNEIERLCLLNTGKDTIQKADSLLFKNNTYEYQELTTSKTTISKQFKQTPIKRLKILKQLFLDNEELSRVEIIRFLNISPPTATTDLKALLREKFIEKIKPNAAPRSHYFKLIRPTQ